MMNDQEYKKAMQETASEYKKREKRLDRASYMGEMPASKAKRRIRDRGLPVHKLTF